MLMAGSTRRRVDSVGWKGKSSRRRGQQREKEKYERERKKLKREEKGGRGAQQGRRGRRGGQGQGRWRNSQSSTLVHELNLGASACSACLFGFGPCGRQTTHALLSPPLFRHALPRQAPVRVPPSSPEDRPPTAISCPPPTHLPYSTPMPPCPPLSRPLPSSPQPQRRPSDLQPCIASASRHCVPQGCPQPPAICNVSPFGRTALCIHHAQSRQDLQALSSSSRS